MRTLASKGMVICTQPPTPFEVEVLQDWMDMATPEIGALAFIASGMAWWGGGEEEGLAPIPPATLQLVERSAASSMRLWGCWRAAKARGWSTSPHASLELKGLFEILKLRQSMAWVWVM